LRRNGNTPEGKERTLQALQPVLSGITRATVRDVTVRYVADLIGVRLESVQALLSGGAAAPGTGGAHPPQRPLSRERGREPLAQTDASLAVEPPPATRENRHPRRLLSLLLQERRLVTLARELLDPALLEDAVLRRLFEKLLRLTEEDLQQVGADELMELWPEQAPLMRSLLVEEGMRLQHTDEPETVLRYEVLRIREQVKDGLMQQFRRQSSARSGADPTADAQGLTPEELTAMEKLRQARADLGETREHYRRTHKLRPEVTLHPKGGGS
ncbi:MAG: hypothetical protein OEW39_10215, partial [Deltaproteobacteria bacterium]|nr:hypothetical protein [Deltaproteobacteria bacterium]